MTSSERNSDLHRLRYGQPYGDKGAEYYERRNRQQQIEFLRKKAATLGLHITLPQA
jgi:hypothetical protein